MPNVWECFGKFQSTLPRGERRYPPPHPFDVLKFQSTLPRGERPKSNMDTIWINQVSIHAPTRGATYSKSKEDHKHVGFNPRSHEGSDTFKSNIEAQTVVSIHAPTRGATVGRSLMEVWTNGFNPRSHEGSDLGNSVIEYSL